MSSPYGDGKDAYGGKNARGGKGSFDSGKGAPGGKDSFGSKGGKGSSSSGSKGGLEDGKGGFEDKGKGKGKGKGKRGSTDLSFALYLLVKHARYEAEELAERVGRMTDKLGQIETMLETLLRGEH